MATHHAHPCLNCGNYPPKSARFCPACGQKTDVHRLTAHSILHDLFHYFTHVERNIFSLVKELGIRPGIVCKEYIAGKRKKYFPPVNFFLITAGLLALSASLFDTFQVAFGNAGATTSVNASPLLQILRSKINWLLLFTTPVIALLYRLFFSRRGTNLIEHLAVSFYCMGYLLLLFALVAAPVFYFVNTLYGFEVLLWLFGAAAILHYSLTYNQLYARKGVLSFLATCGISAAVFVVLFLLILLALRLYYAFAGR